MRTVAVVLLGFTALTALPVSTLVAAQGPWPESCRLHRPTIFDRPVEIHDEMLPVPEVSRHEEALGLEGRLVEISGGVRLWVEEVGEGPPLLLVSGGPGTSHHYFHPDLIPAASFARLIYVDLRGVGRSDRVRPPGGYTVSSAVDDLEALRRALGVESWSILGYSYGGVVAQLYALEHPERLDRLVMASTAVPMDVDVGLGIRQRDFMSAEEVARVEEIYTVDSELGPPVHSDRVPEALQRSLLFNAFLNGDWKRRHLCRMSRSEIARFARYELVHDRDYYREMVESGSVLDLTGRFDEFQVPTLILEGRWDLAFAPWKAEVMRERYPRAEVVVLEEAGHTLFEDDPTGFFGALRRFMGDERSAPGPRHPPFTATLTVDAARAAVAGALEEARGHGWKMVFAVLDVGGHPVLVERMDGAPPASVAIALEKARAALAFRRPTREMETWVRGGDTHLLGLPGIVPVEGGVPVRVEGRVLGAVGVSGASSAEDGRAAAAALRAVSAILDLPVEGVGDDPPGDGS